jgi:hypothetical protein
LNIVPSQEQPITEILALMMPTMTKPSHWVLCLCLLLVLGLGFMLYCSSPTGRANIKKTKPTSTSVPRKLIRLALVDLHHNKTATNDRWLTLEAIRKLIYSRFDFNDGIDITVGELKRVVNEYGPVTTKISNGNETEIYLRMKEATKINLTRFVLLSRSKDSQPEEPAKGKAWTHQGLELSKASIVDYVLQCTSMLESR